MSTLKNILLVLLLILSLYLWLVAIISVLAGAKVIGLIIAIPALMFSYLFYEFNKIKSV